MTEPIVIVGASLAGATAAITLREEGFNGAITLAGDEPHVPYQRPPLSKGFLQGSAGLDEVFLHPGGWYRDHDIDLRIGDRATAIGPAEHTVSFESGEILRYHKLLLATGSSPRKLDVPGAQLDGVRYLRTIEDCMQLRDDFASCSRVAIIGAGWIGLETAAAARGAGLDVTVMEAGPLPLLRALGTQAAQMFADLHRGHGVDLRFGSGVAAIEETVDKVKVVVLTDGTRIETDLIIAGIGVIPNLALAESAGLRTNQGVLASEHLQTSDPDIYVAGDIAEAFHPVLTEHIHVEHWANAKNQGATAARSMLGQPASYDRLPYFYTDQYDLGMEYTGYIGPDGYDEVVFRGDPASQEVIAFWLRDNRLLAGMCVNVWDQMPAIAALISSGLPVRPGQLADPSTPIDQLSRSKPQATQPKEA